jgi:hypothetical protein
MNRLCAIPLAACLIASVASGCYMKFQGTETITDGRLQGLEERVAVLEERAGIAPVITAPAGPQLSGQRISPTNFSDDNSAAGSRQSGQSGKVRLSQPPQAPPASRTQTVTSDSLDLN